MTEDLERREREFKKNKGDEDLKARQERGELERLKQDGKRRREDADRAAQGVVDKSLAEEKSKSKEMRRKDKVEERTGVIELGPFDMTLKLKWNRSQHNSITTAAALTSFISSALSVFDPEIDSIALSTKFLSNTSKGKHGSGVVAFKSLRAAIRLMEAKEGSSKDAWDGFEINWASGSPPACLTTQAPDVSKPVSFSSSVSNFFLARLHFSDFLTIDARGLG